MSDERATVADLEALRAQAAADADAWKEIADRASQEIEALRRDVEAKRVALHAAHAQAAALRAELEGAQAAARDARAALESLRASSSWQLTAPLRSASARLRRPAATPQPSGAAAEVGQDDGASWREAARSIAESGLFDRGFYLERYPDVVLSGVDPLEHFVRHGAAEGRDPNELFSTSYYLARDEALAASATNPVVHYLTQGARQGRDPGPSFSTARYLELYPDVAEAGMNPLAHYLTHGRAEGRIAPPVSASPSTQGPSDPFPRLARVARAELPGPAMLIFDADVPTPDRDSGSVRMRAIVEILVELGWSVTFVAHADDPQPGYDEQLTGLGVVVLHGADSARRHLRDAGGRYRCAWLSRPPLAEMYTAMVRAFALRASLVYDSVDLHWIRHLRAFELSTDPEDARLAEHFRKLEAFAVTSSDRVVAITDAEQRTIEEHWPRTHPVIVPNVHDVRLLPTPFRDRSGLLFVGNYRHPPNVDAMIWFVRDVLPLVRREIPEARLSIVGANVPDALRTLAGAGVDVPGWIQDVDPSFAEARVFVCPLRYGAGMKGKIGQAMSLGTPVVTTSVGAEGMRLASGVHALVEDDPVAFAAAVVRLYRDEALWSSVRCAAAAHVDQSFSRSAARRVIEDLLAPLSGPAAGPGARA